ncbi:hypothetical protein WJX75_007193 [Coccomyxa subellipsoidea]|uniref:Secreted protein n=1 Tax=Coccomyxa subellipsoidea TaxID=248742 RepID=A0ABR2YQ75_9CHLO
MQICSSRHPCSADRLTLLSISAATSLVEADAPTAERRINFRKERHCEGALARRERTPPEKLVRRPSRGCPTRITPPMPES